MHLAHSIPSQIMGTEAKESNLFCTQFRICVENSTKKKADVLRPARWEVLNGKNRLSMSTFSKRNVF